MRDWLDKLLGLGSSLDYCTPSIAFERDAAELSRGDIADFGIVSDSGYTQAQIKKALARYDISSWGWSINLNGTLMFTVRQNDAKRTAVLLSGWGIPIYSYPVVERGVNRFISNCGTMFIAVLIIVFVFIILPTLLR